MRWLLIAYASRISEDNHFDQYKDSIFELFCEVSMDKVSAGGAGDVGNLRSNPLQRNRPDK